MKVDLHNKRLVLSGMAVIAVVLFVAGMVAAYQSRHDTICPDGKPPVQQQDVGIGQVEYLCHDGKIVTK